ncbi:HAMP domain-containing sensor histidine kinase [Clostridium chrysemydis]|uniref:HAMP domain-containing sensor histidine kinase n=1 Tax=Clostridium chrysemydis TaxID=2665504 RepID=UPI001884409F|nr:HAMP domain-containing sensor histidine kinase [Clostridium chrysemydis]
MNLIILISVIVIQLVFQALYFDKYYLNKKEESLVYAITEFENFIPKAKSEKEIITYMNNQMRKDNIALCMRDSDLSGGYSLESYMGERQIVIKGSDNKEYKVILGNQFPNININKGDEVKVSGSSDRFGFTLANKFYLNGKEVNPYYNIIPSAGGNVTYSSLNMMPAIIAGNEININGKVEKVIPKDNYYSLGNTDMYLGANDKNNILSNEKYITKINLINSLDEVLVLTEKTDNGYLIAMTPIAEVKDVLGTLNSYYLMILIVAFVIVIIISLIYSRYMSRPLVEMSNIAKKISECDFNYKYDVKTEDEIGKLGESLNQISNNLEKSLNDLKKSNELLKEEMNEKEKEEEKRKELVANISHELKTPITIIQGNINCVKSGMIKENIYEDIIEETNRMNDLVKEMLEISKLESPTFILKKEAFDLGQIFLKEKDKLKAMIKDRNLKIINNEFDEVIVYGDEKRINQVITNLLTNAIKYTPEGENIIVEIVKRNNKEYVFSIENFGVTLDKNEVLQIWDQFYRKEKSRNKKFGGTGLGLAIVKRILEVHKSEFGVESKKNSVKFYFTIPKCNEY